MGLDKLSDKFQNLQSQLGDVFDQVLDEVASIKDEQGSVVNDLKAEKSELQKKYDEAQSKLNHIEEQLKNTVEQLENITTSKAKGVDALQLLDVYLVLMENVFESAAHTRLLLIMHGEKDQYTLEELTMAAGISGLQVRQAVHELRNSNVVDYDEEQNIVKLRMRFME